MKNPPPDTPACHGQDPQLFEFDMFYDLAIDICRTCPVRAWCLSEVDPRKYLFFEGVAGGYAWNNGHPNLRYALTDDLEQDAAFVSYMRYRPVRGAG